MSRIRRTLTTLCVLLGPIAGFGGSAGSTEPTANGAVRVIVSKGVEASAPSWSPDGALITAGSERSGILVVRAVGGAPRVLTNNPHHNAPVWAPTGSLIAFVDDSAAGRAPIYVVDSAGTSPIPRKVLDESDAYLASQPWSPDSRLLLYSNASGSVATVTAESGESQVVDAGRPCGKGEELRGLRWNATGAITGFCGRRLVIKEPGASSWRTVDRGGGRQAIEGPGQVLWWVDGRDPAAFLRREGAAVSTIPAGGPIGTFDINPRTGAVVAAVQGRGLVLLEASGKLIGRVSDCTTDKQYIPSPNEGFLDAKLDRYPRDGAPAWSPDGRKIAYVRLVDPSSPATLCVAEVDVRGGAME